MTIFILILLECNSVIPDIIVGLRSGNLTWFINHWQNLLFIVLIILMKAIVILTWNIRVLFHIFQIDFNSLWVTILILHGCVTEFHGGEEHILRAAAATVFFLGWDYGIVSSLRLSDVILKLITSFLSSNINWRFVGFYSVISLQDFSFVAMRAIISLLSVLDKLVSYCSSFLIRVVLSLFAHIDAKSWYSSICFSSGLRHRFTSSFK